MAESVEQKLTAAMRKADRIFEKVGGSTRHYVMDCLLPLLETFGITVVERSEIDELRKENERLKAALEEQIRDNYMLAGIDPDEVEEDKDRVDTIARKGHTYHCACRQVWGDGECECGKSGEKGGGVDG